MTNTPLILTAQFRRRIYVALVVTLATFLLAITGVGFVCHGYDFSPPAKNLRSGAGEQNRFAERKLGEQLHSAAESASKDLVEAEGALANFTIQHFKLWPAKLERASNSHEVRNPPASLTSNPHETQPPAMLANPRWQELHDQLDKLKLRRSALLETFLPAHPAIQAIDTSIDALETRLSTVPQQVPVPTPITPGSKPIESPEVPTQTTSESPTAEDFAAQWQAEAAEYQKLAKRAERAQQQYCDTAKQETAALKSCTEVLEKPLVVANLQAPIGQANPKATILWCGIASLILGMVFGWNAKYAEAVFHSAAEVRQQLGLSVLGLLSLSPGQTPRERPVAESPWIGRLVTTSELLLVAMIACLAVTAATDRQFWHALILNPLSACSQKWWC
jgi:hypothetical protein